MCSSDLQAYPLLHKGLGHLAALYLLYLLFARYYLSYHKTIYHLQFQCLQKTLLKTAYHFLLLLVGFDTLTYQKDYDRSPILVGHQVFTLIQRYSHYKVEWGFLRIIKVSNVNLVNVMKTSLTIIPNVSSGAPSSLLEFL